MAVVAVIGALLAPWAIDVLLGPAFEEAVGPFRILLLAELGLAWYLFDSTLLVSSHRVRTAAVAALFGLVTIIVADFVLIDQYGIDGAAVASVVTYWAMAAVARALLVPHVVAARSASWTPVTSSRPRSRWAPRPSRSPDDQVSRGGTRQPASRNFVWSSQRCFSSSCHESGTGMRSNRQATPSSRLFWRAHCLR